MGLPESARDSYRKKAADSGYSSVSPPSPNKRAKRIIKNIMKEVGQLEDLAGHALVLCAYDGSLYQGGSSFGELVLKTNVVETFTNYLTCSEEEKQDISVKKLQELFNSTYSELTAKDGSKMPYSKVKQLGIIFKDLPLDLQPEMSLFPKKPTLYGSGQRRKLWLTRHEWSLTISLSTATTHTTTSNSHTANATSHNTTSTSQTANATSHTTTITPCTTTATPPISTTTPCTTTTTPRATTTTPPATTTTPRTTTTTPRIITARPLITTATPCTTSANPHTTTVPVSIPSASLSSLSQHSTSCPSGVVFSKGKQLYQQTDTGFVLSVYTEFGMPLPSTNRIVHAVYVLSA
ncbi:unnamed protein product [Porites evermanni]|uniref:Uncharacterized protein n=1 Tax=Porites evermanni TaxID=104178 RepID=A0ABN8LV57_9CNID|nr:unnamed protein product [Porites evermanni]